MLLRVALAAISGVLFALSFPDFAFGWLAFIALLPLFIALSRSPSGWSSFFLGWIFQTIAWLMMVPWVIRVMSHYGGLPYALGVVIFVAMALYLGLYGGAFAAIVHRIRPGASLGRWLLVPLAWAAIEYARTHLLNGFPWSLVAASLVDFTSLIQFDRVAGPYLIGAMALAPAAVAAWLITARPRGAAPAFAIASVVIVMFLWWTTGLVAAKLIVRPTGTAPTVNLVAPGALYGHRIRQLDVAVKKVIPGINGPTVIDIMNGGDRVAVHAVVDASTVFKTIGALKALDASGILVTRVERLMP